MSDPTKHFDAPRPSGRLASVRALGRAHWGVLLALLAVTTFVVFAGMAIVVADALAAALLAQAIEATPIVAVVDPQETDPQALGLRIHGLPGIAGATWRGKDDALKALVADGLPAPEGRNPLPDTWTLRLDPGSVLGEPATLSRRVDDASQRLKQLAGVGAVRSDLRWTAELDRRIEDWRQLRVRAGVIGFFVLAVLAVSGGFLAGRAMGDALVGLQRVSVITLIIGLEAMGAFLVVATAAAVADAYWNVESSPVLQRTFEQPIVDDRAVAAVALVVILILQGVAIGTGGRRRGQ